MNSEDKELEQQGYRLLEPLRYTPGRDAQKANARRRQFIDQASAVLSENSPAQAVSESPFQRLNGWKSGIINPFNRKERASMFSILTAIVITVSILFGGAGATVYAAQDSLPTDALYSVKLFSEDLRVDLATQPQARMNILLDYADRRVNEIAALLSRGEPVPEAVMNRFLFQMEAAYQIAAGLDQEGQARAMTMIQLHARNQERILNMAQPVSPGQGTMTQEQIQAMLREQIRKAENELVDPTQLQQQFRLRLNQGGVTSTITSTLTITGTPPFTTPPALQYGPGPDAGPGPSYGPGPDAGPGPSYGPGPDTGPNEEAPPPGPGPQPTVDPGSTKTTHDQDAMNANDQDNGGGNDTSGASGGNSGQSGGSNGGGGGGH